MKEMTIKVLKRTATAFLAAFFLTPQITSAAEGTEYIVQKEFDSVMPTYMAGHNGDPAWIKGFTFEGDILLEGAKIGTVAGEATLWHPPMNFIDLYDEASLRIVNTITGVGSFEVYAQAVSLGSSTSATIGDVTVAWTGSLANGTGALANTYGLSAGNIVANLFTGTAEGTEVLRIRWGY